MKINELSSQAKAVAIKNWREGFYALFGEHSEKTDVEIVEFLLYMEADFDANGNIALHETGAGEKK